MAFADTQVRKLRSKLSPRHVKSREAEGQTLHYLEGWHVVAEANRIFGFDGWDRETVSSDCVWTRQQGQRYCAAYVARVRITVRAGEDRVIREGCGVGESNAASPGQAHDFAAKAAETDATKRALSTFGNAFGLSLYGGTGITEAESRRGRPGSQSTPTLRSGGEDSLRAIAAVTQSPSKESPSPTTPPPECADERQPGAATPGAPMALGVDRDTMQAPEQAGSSTSPVAHPEVPLPPPDRSNGFAGKPVDKSVLALAEPRRIRDPDHLRFVASQPCLICGRVPAEAHHLRFAQPRALGRKVSDAFTVPLCALHHRDLHSRGDEVAWWAERRIDPLTLADQLWATSNRRATADNPLNGATALPRG